MIKIYHNPKCSKSRQALDLLEEKGINSEVINYMKNPLTPKELTNTINLLGIKPIELIRKNEAVWKEKYASLNLSDNELIQAMIDEPKLMERPIVINNQKAVIARPTENINDIL